MLRALTASAIAAALAASLGAQAPCYNLPIGTDLNLTDDSTSGALALGFTFNYGGIAYTDIQVCSNGYIWFGTSAPAGGDFSPTAAELLSGGPRICPLWSDFNPGATGSGHVYFDNSIPGQAIVTWAGVYAFGTTTPVTFQVTLDASSSVSIAYGAPAVPGTLNTTILIGGSPGGGATANPVSLATRPILSASDTFYEAIPAVNGVPIAYGNFKMLWSPTVPGYVVSDITCTPNALLTGSATSVGAGCPAANSISLYETFTSPAAVDLNGLDQSFLPNGCGGYIVLPGVSPTFFAGFTNNLLLTDDTTANVALPFSFPHAGGAVSNVWVSSNGFLTLGGTDPFSGCCTGSFATMSGGSPRICGFWEDLNPGAGGGVFADLDTATGEFCITWNAVNEFGSTNTNTFQIALSPNGQFTIRWVALANAGGTWLTGYTSGGGATDPGPTDMSTVAGLGLGCRTFPLVLGNAPGTRPTAGQSFTANVSGIQGQPNGVFCILLISTEIPGGFPLDGLGLTGCTAFVNLPEITSFFNLTLGASTTSFPITIPSDNAFVGLQLMTQAISDDLTANAFGYRVSNGVRWVIGNV